MNGVKKRNAQEAEIYEIILHCEKFNQHQSLINLILSWCEKESNEQNKKSNELLSQIKSALEDKSELSLIEDAWLKAINELKV